MVAIIIKEKPNFVKKKKGAVYGGILSIRNGPLARMQNGKTKGLKQHGGHERRERTKYESLPPRAAGTKSNADSW